MTTERFFDIILVLIGLYSVVRFKYLGKTAIEQRKKLSNSSGQQRLVKGGQTE